MRDIAEQRDNLLRGERAISPDRLQRLHAILASELPVETALFAAGRQRDESLSVRVPVLPATIRAALAQQLPPLRAAPKPLDALRLSRIRLHTWWGSLGPTRVAIAAIVILLAAGALHFADWSSVTRGLRISDPTLQPTADPKSAPEFAHQGLPPHPEERSFTASSDHLTLRVGTMELASLQPSLLTINRVFLPDRYEADRSLPLDLPIRQILIDAEAARTP